MTGITWPNPFENITRPDVGNLSDLNFSNLMEKGILWQGFQPYINVVGDFFWGMLLGVVAIAVYNYRQDAKLALGFLMAAVVITAGIIPGGWIDFFTLILGICITGLLYEVFVVSKRRGEDEPKGRHKRPTKSDEEVF